MIYGLQPLMSAYGDQWTQLMVATIVFILLILVVFFFAQKTLIQGITTTGRKN